MNSIYLWSEIGNKTQLGKYAKQLVSMEFQMHGYQVSKPSSKQNDFTIKKGVGNKFDIRVRSIRPTKDKYPYIFFYRSHSRPENNLLAVIVLLRDENPPNLYLIQSTVWESPDAMFTCKNYKGSKNNLEWGVNLTDKHIDRLKGFAI